MSNSSIQPIVLTLSDATTPGKSGPGNDRNDRIICIPQNSNISEASPTYSLMSYPGHSLLEGSYPSAEMQLAIHFWKNSNTLKDYGCVVHYTLGG